MLPHLGIFCLHLVSWSHFNIASIYFVDYGNSLNFYDFNSHKLQESINLGENGRLPLEIRFLHDPNSSIGFVGCALSSTIYRFELNQVNDVDLSSVLPDEKAEQQSLCITCIKKANQSVLSWFCPYNTYGIL